jgi:hypothetical protein
MAAICNIFDTWNETFLAALHDKKKNQLWKSSRQQY